MKIEDLQQKISFLQSDSEKVLNIYVTTLDSDVELFNIEQKYIPELCGMFNKYIYGIVSNTENSLEEYSCSSKRENAIYRFDLKGDDNPVEFNRMSSVVNILNPNLFHSDITKINAVYGVIRDSDNVLSFYKEISPLDKTYANKTYLFGKFNHSNDFVKLSESLLRLSPSVQMIHIGEDDILFDIKKLEKSLNLGAVLAKAAQCHIKTLIDRNLIETGDYITNFCSKPQNCKKLIHAMTMSEVIRKDLTNEQIVVFATSPKRKNKIKLKVSDDNKFIISSEAEAKRFIKLLDDDYLRSELTETDYEAGPKGLLK